MQFVFIGNTCLDLLLPLEIFPLEDRKYRLSQPVRRSPGGNATNSSVVVAQLPGNHTVHLVAASSDPKQDTDAAQLLSDLMKWPKLVPHLIPLAPQGFPTTYALITKGGSRTILNSRNLGELDYTSIRAGLLKALPWLDVNAASPRTVDRVPPVVWVHFESRTVHPMAQMLKELNHFNVFTSVEIEKTRECGNVLELLPLADVVVMSREFVLQQGFDNRQTAFQKFEQCVRDNALLVLPWGAAGASASLRFVRPDKSAPRYLRVQVSAAELSGPLVSTLGAGDTFNAALCYACANTQVLRELWTRKDGQQQMHERREGKEQKEASEEDLLDAVQRVIEFANLVAALKCTQPDFDFSATMKHNQSKLEARTRAML